jgi:hypothetical protein
VAVGGGELRCPTDRLLEIANVTAVALHAAGNSTEAVEFTDAVLRDALPVEQEAQVRLEIANMFAICRLRS